MNHADLEKIYEALALKTDEVGKQQCEIFLAKLALLMAYKNGNVDEVLNCIDEAADSL